MTSELGAKGPNTGRKVLGDSALTVAERIISQIAQFTIFVVAARVLGPAEFGVFALVSACAILLLRAAEVGWAPFIMSWSGDSTVPRQVLFIAMLSGVAFGVLGGIAAMISGVFGVGPETILLMQLFAVWVVLANVSSAQKGVMIWQQKLKSSAICEISGEIVGLIVAVTALLSGMGVLALAFGRLAFQSTHLVMSFLVTRLAPLPGLKGQLLNDLWVFSAQLFVSRMLIHIRLYVATFIIGGYLGPAAVGYFRAADRLVSAAAEIIAVPGQLLAWTQFRKARDNGDIEGQVARINLQMRQYMKILISAGAPVLLWLMVMSDEVINGLLSAQWLPAAPLVAILAGSRLLFLIGIVTEPLMSLVGEARRLPAFTATVFAVSLGLTFIAVQFGLYAVAWSQLVIAVLVFFATLWLFHKYAGINWSAVAADLRGTVVPMLCGVGVLIGLDYFSEGHGIPDLVQALGFGVVAIIVYAGAIMVFDRGFWYQMRSALGGGGAS